jgi:hypothetical protein
MDTVNHETVIRQLFSWLPKDLQHRCLFDRYAKKLTVGTRIQIFVAAQLNNWSSYEDMESQICAHHQWQALFQFTSISGSQLSRKLDLIPTELLQWIFLQGVARTHEVTGSPSGVTKKIGRLRIIHFSTIRLPLKIGEWAQISRNESSVKMLLRFVAASPDTVFPDQMVPTSR